MKTWLDIEEFSRVVGKDPSEIEKLCQDNKLVSKVEDGKRLIESASATSVLLPKKLETELVIDNPTTALGFVEKTVGTILTMHERVVDAKDETLTALRSENQFLKEGLLAMQDLYEEDRKEIEVLTKQLSIAQEELEFVKRKYKLMWGKAIEYAGNQKR